MIDTLAERFEKEFIDFVLQPGRYIGGEVNEICKDLAQCDVRIALCFPDVYEVAMSHTGLAILYTILNAMEGVAAERVFCPWLDAEDVMRHKQLPLFSLESKIPLNRFDVLAFSLTTELCYTNVLNMLDLGGLPVRSKDRNTTDPLVIAGGGMANTCEPMADFIDAFILGDGEQSLEAFVTFVREHRAVERSRQAFLLRAAQTFEWLYVPCYYESMIRDGRFSEMKTLVPGLSCRRENAIVEDLDQTPSVTRPLIPHVQAVHERVSVEIMRGCPGRCRFCQVSFCKRPIRIKQVDTIVEQAKACYQATGYDTVSLLSLSSAEYPHLHELLETLQRYFNDKHVGLSVPSLRVDRQLQHLPQLLNSVRKSGLTIAVEAASERLRRMINKPICDEDLIEAALASYRAGWLRLKLYFIVGFPGETDEDIEHIVDLSWHLARRRKEVDGRTAQISVAISWLVPKPHTPMGWFGQKSRAYFEHARQCILDRKYHLKARSLTFKFHDIDNSVLESALGRGDRRLGDVIETAWRLGARFDLWSECFDSERWRNAFRKNHLDMDELATQSYSPIHPLPWEHLGGPDKKQIVSHYQDMFKNIPA